MFNSKTPPGGNIDMDENGQNRGDYLLEVLELAMNRDPDQDFELLLVIEREKQEIQGE